MGRFCVESEVFPLPYANFEKTLKEFIADEIVVVSFLGKADYEQLPGYARNIFNKPGRDPPLAESNKPWDNFECRYNSTEKVLFVWLKGSYETTTLRRVLTEMDHELKAEGFLPVWGKIRHRCARALTILLAISHILVICCPSLHFELSSIQLLKSLSFLRSKFQPLISSALKKEPDLSVDWVQNGRLCTPRLLFHFVKRSMTRSNVYDLKKLEHSLEDQIYLVLRKIRLVKNICDRASFSIPPNDEFVFISMDDEDKFGRSELLRGLFDDCAAAGRSLEMAKSPFRRYCLLEEPQDQDFYSYSGPSGQENTEENEEQYDSEDYEPTHSFSEFLFKHVSTAHKQGFYDNMGKYSQSKPSFILPSLGDWLKGANVLFSDSNLSLDDEESSISKYLEKVMNEEVRFSDTRCSKVLPLALAAYQESLPTHYTESFHKKKVNHAVAVFTRQARGPKVKKYVEQLKEECDKYWKTNRQMCEKLSLTGQPCTKPVHNVTVQTSQTWESDHWNTIFYVSTCNCGLIQGRRQDPFIIRVGNYDFYQTVAKECGGCRSLESILFPVFQPSIQDFRPAELKSVAMSLGNDLKIPGSAQNLSVAKLTGESASSAPTVSHLTYNLNHLELSSDQESSAERNLERNASTTEYLPTMLHTESPLGLLPQFPSWSLVCRGPSSLYSHNVGLQDQPGFIPGSAYLLPWDVTIRQKERCWPTLSETPRKLQNSGRGCSYRKFRGPRDLFSVKIFVGVEYECLRGHRFMSSGPGKVLKATGNGLVKDNATKVTKGNMPLYLSCPCGKSVAQLMRVHIVTPKAPVYVTINPKVRPAPAPCPVFVTGAQRPTPLSQSAYWVLRLPFVYACERQTYAAPEESPQLTHGELLGPMYGITEVDK